MPGPKVNFEYMLLLRQVMSCLVRGLYDPRLQAPSAEEITDWFRSVELQDVETLLPEAYRLAMVTNCAHPCGGSDISTHFRELTAKKISTDA